MEPKPEARPSTDPKPPSWCGPDCPYYIRVGNVGCKFTGFAVGAVCPDTMRARAR